MRGVGMLIIGQPKSASTSLMATLGKILDVKVREGLIKNPSSKACEGFDTIQTCHSNMSERSELYLSQLINGQRVFKEHLLPTPEHIERLRDINKPVIILLREPKDSYDCYDRLFNSNNNIRTDRLKLKKDIKKFYDGYKGLTDKIFLIIKYKDLILNYEKTMKKILKHLGIKGKKIVPLEKRRYTGVGEKRILNNEKKVELEDLNNYEKPKINEEVELKDDDNSTAKECINKPIKDDSTVDESES
jgi:hypothetical protein